jgi:nitrite reductase (NADH) small subunit
MSPVAIDTPTVSDAAPSPAPAVSATWVTVCKRSDLIPGRGVAALINNHQYALFLTNQGELFAVDNRDPFCDANVMARGIIGDRNGEPKVASPMLKQTFSLQTGICFEDPTFTINTYQIRTTPTQTIEIQVPTEPPALG